MPPCPLLKIPKMNMKILAGSWIAEEVQDKRNRSWNAIEISTATVFIATAAAELIAVPPPKPALQKL
jgi:hypothetical protein